MRPHELGVIFPRVCEIQTRMINVIRKLLGYEDKFFNLLEASAAWIGFSHGTNDAQKTMGIIALILFTPPRTAHSTICRRGCISSPPLSLPSRSGSRSPAP